MDRQKIERSIKGLSEWQMHVQAESDIDTNISTAIEALKAQLSREGTTSDQPVATDTNVGSNSEIPNRSDCISRQAAIDIERNATVDTNPSHFEAHQKFTQFMDDAEVSSFGRWQWANGFNTALTAVGIDLKKLPPAQPEPKEGHWIKHTDSFDGEQYECSECGVLWEFNDGTPEDNKAYYCPKCGAKMKGGDE